MSTEQSEGETQAAPAVTANTQADITEQAATPSPTTKADITEQATTPTPTTHVKKNPNPKRVAAGKMVAERTKKSREQEKKIVAEASLIIANNKAKSTAAAPEPAPTTENSGLSINQWIGVGGLAVSLAGIYYKREELKAAFSKKKPPEPAPASVEPEPARALQRKEGLIKMV